MSSSDKIVYAPRAKSGHANSRKVRSTRPKVIVTKSYRARWHPSAYGLGLSFPRSTAPVHLRPRATNWTLAVHSPAFVSLRVRYYYTLIKHFTPKGHYFAHWRGKKPFLRTVSGAQTMFLHVCVKKKLMNGILNAWKKWCSIWKYFNFTSYTYIKLYLPSLRIKDSSTYTLKLQIF